MKLVFDAESVIYDLMDWPEIVEDIMEDHSKAKNWLKSSAASIRNIADDIAYDPASTCRHFLDDYNIVCEEGEGEAWKYKDKQADKIDAFLPQLERDLLNEIDNRERKQVSLRIKQSTIRSICEALYDIRNVNFPPSYSRRLDLSDDLYDDLHISVNEALRITVDNFEKSDWKELARKHKENINRQIQYLRQAEWEAKLDAESGVRVDEDIDDLIVFEQDEVYDSMHNSLRHKVSLRIKETTFNDVCDALYDIRNVNLSDALHGHFHISENEALIAIVDNLDPSDWKELARKYKDSISRQINNLQYVKQLKRVSRKKTV